MTVNSLPPDQTRPSLSRVHYSGGSPIHQPLSSGASFVVGPNARDVLIDGAANGIRSDARTANWSPERFVVFREGAQDVTVRGYDVSGFYNVQTASGLFVFNGFTAASAQAPIQNVVIEDINVLNPAGTAGACSGTSGVGCRARLTSFIGTGHTAADRVHVHGLTFRNMFVQGMNEVSTTTAGSNTGHVSRTLDFTGGWGGGTGTGGAPHIRDLTIVDNWFVNNNGQPQAHRAFVALPPAGRLSGTTVIERNLFSTQASGRVAINVPAAATAQGAHSTAASQIFIRDNHFDGYNHAAGAVHFNATGTVTFSGNTFSRGGGQATTANEESVSGTAGGGMVRNRNNTANQNIHTWFPVGNARALDAPVPAEARPVAGSRVGDPDQPTCLATVDVQRPTATVGSGATATSLPGAWVCQVFGVSG